MMTEIYDTGIVKIQSQGIGDDTGTAATTGGEIQRDITEIMKSTLNSIGGNVQFIEYDPAFIQNQMVTGYSNFEEKTDPGRGGHRRHHRVRPRSGNPRPGNGRGRRGRFYRDAVLAPSQTVASNTARTARQGKARITLDFNLKDFKTLAAIKKMTTTNSMVVNKAMANEEFGITLFGTDLRPQGVGQKGPGPAQCGTVCWSR